MELTTYHDVQRDLARQVREERLGQNITQKELARRAQVGEVTVRRLEQGQGSSLANYLRIASCLGCMPTAKDLLRKAAPLRLEEVRTVDRQRASRV